MLKRLEVPLDRDVIFLAESGEEADPVGVGMNHMVRKHMKEIDAEFAMTEGGGATIDGTRVTRVNIGSAEKLPARARLEATGTAGHGSVPRMDNALIHLSAAVEKVGRWETPMELNDTTRTYFEKLANISTPEKAAHYKALLSGDTRAAQAYLREHEPGLYSILRTSVIPTMLKAGVGLNVIPSEAEATLDIRAVPGENLDEFFANMGKVINDPEVKIVPLPRTRPSSPAARLDTEMYRVMADAARAVYAGAVVLPSMLTGASDNSQLRAKGIQSYGVGPASTEDDALRYPAHGDVERLAESSLYPFVEYVWNTVIGVASHTESTSAAASQ
jgi:acetylornithine deacetylase/succinyl-diaminopimelate desuccinylase-like protein